MSHFLMLRKCIFTQQRFKNFDFHETITLKVTQGHSYTIPFKLYIEGMYTPNVVRLASHDTYTVGYKPIYLYSRNYYYRPNYISNLYI